MLPQCPLLLDSDLQFQADKRRFRPKLSYASNFRIVGVANFFQPLKGNV